MVSVNRVAKDFVHRIGKVRYLNNEVNDLRMEVGRWSLENAANIVFEKRLGCLEFDTKGEELGRQMIEANAEIFKVGENENIGIYENETNESFVVES